MTLRQLRRRHESLEKQLVASRSLKGRQRFNKLVYNFVGELRAWLEEARDEEQEWGQLVAVTWAEYLRAEDRQLNAVPFPARSRRTPAHSDTQGNVDELLLSAWLLPIALTTLPLVALDWLLKSCAALGRHDQPEEQPKGDETSSTLEAHPSPEQVPAGTAQHRRVAGE